MKRIGYLHEKIYDEENINQADKKARKNKSSYSAIKKHDEWKDFDNLVLSISLKNLNYKTSEYTTFKIYEPKEREIYKLPYYPDRIAHHAIMNVLEPIWKKIFISHTYSCIKGRGIHKVVKDLKKDLYNNRKETTYCLKLDIRKFYPSINHDILFDILKKKIKDRNLLTILREIIDSANGVPIGNYLSQYFANLYLSYFDHWLKEEVKCRYYRYADDIVILGNNKDRLRSVLLVIKIYLKHVLKLELKPNYQIFPVESRGIDFIGYKFYHTHILLRKSIKKRLFQLISKFKQNKIDIIEFSRRIQSYYGWLKHCNSKHLLQKIFYETGLKLSNWQGIEDNISNFYNKKLWIIEVVPYSKYFEIHFIYKNKPYTVKSRNVRLYIFLCMRQFPLCLKLTNNGNTNTINRESLDDLEIR